MAVAVPFTTDATGGDLALTDAARTMTYGELEDRVGVVAIAIAQRCGPRAIVAIEPSPNVDDVAWYLGAVAGDNVVLLVDPAAPAPRKAELYRRYAPQLRPADDADADNTAVTVAGRPCVLSPAPAAAPHPELSLLLSTSGSTASPKVVRLSRSAVTSNAAAIASALGLVRGDRAAANLPLSFSYGLSVLHSHLAAGATVALSDAGIAERAFWDFVAAHRCTSLAGVPSTYRALRSIRLLDKLGSIRTLTQAGGRMDDATADDLRGWVRATHRRLFIMYGQTEATARITVLHTSELDDRSGSVGRPIHGTLAVAPDPDGGGVDVGEILYQGANVMMGYAEGADDLVRGDELGGRLATGDTGHLDGDGYLYVTGRLSRYAKVDGHRLNLDEIEATIAPAGDLRALEVEGSIVLVHDRRAVDTGLLTKLLSTHFNLRPRSWCARQIDAIPLTGNGKVDLTALRQVVRA